MTTGDLIEIGERLDFCNKELRTITGEIHLYGRVGIESRIVPLPAYHSLQARVVAPVPTALRSRVGTTIHEVRSCLDALACVLAARNGKTPSGVYFPISKNEDVFLDDGMRKIRKLRNEDQQKIISLRPFGGGNDFLFGVHEFDRKRKHQKLGAAFPKSGGLGFRRASNFQMESVYSSDLSGAWAEIGRINLGYDADFDVVPNVVFDAPPQLQGRSVESVIEEFIRQTREIVARFR